MLAEKEMVIALNVSPKTNISADANLLELMLSNLLSNAMKYGSSGARLDITWEQDTKTLSFTDYGPGIPTAFLPHLFDRFYRTDTSRNAKIPGTGLGLAIAKKMADLQGIQLSVASEEGRGTTFFLQFPDWF